MVLMGYPSRKADVGGRIGRFCKESIWRGREGGQSGERFDDPLQLGQQILLAMESALLDQSESIPRRLKLSRIDVLQQSLDVNQILGPARQDFESDERAGPSHWNHDSGKDLKEIRRSHDFLFYT